MSDITVIGLGLMASVLGGTIQYAGHDLTVCNRSVEKLQPFIDERIAATQDVAAAKSASPVTLISIDNYTVTNTMMRLDEVEQVLAVRTIIQLSTDAPREASEAAILDEGNMRSLISMGSFSAAQRIAAKRRDECHHIRIILKLIYINEECFRVV